MPLEGERFLHQRDPKLHTSDPVEHEQERRALSGEATHNKPAEKLADWMEILKRTHTGHRDDQRVLERIKDWYHTNYSIRPEDIPESYFDNQRRIAREQGHGDIEITDELRRNAAEIIRADQASTLDRWLDYLTSEDSDAIPLWAKYWAFTGMLKLSSFDKEKHAFGTRDKGTVAPFPDLDREAFAYTIDVIVKKAKGEDIPLVTEDPDFKRLLDGANFGKLYAYAIEKVTPTETSELAQTEGKWVKYVRDSDPLPLVRSLQGYGTGWCTAGESTAESQLKAGDFYVFYSLDKDGNPTVPRAAIRMQENHIAEVRGIAAEQNLDPYIGEVVKDKLAEFPDGKLYEKKSADMRHLTELEERMRRGVSPSDDDLRFLYEIDSPITGFGYDRDPRIEELLAGRDVKGDLAKVFHCSQEEISITKKEALSGNIKFHYGDVFLDDLTSAEGLKLPSSIGGSLFLNSLTFAEGLKLPDSIGGSLDLRSLTSADGLKLPSSIGGSLDLLSLTSAEGLTLPDSIGGDLELSSLTSADGLKLPSSIGGYLYLDCLTSAENLKLPSSIGGSLDLRSLTSAEGLKLPSSIGGHLSLNGLTSAEGLKLPDSIGGDLNLNSLTFVEGLKLPDSIGGHLDLDGLSFAENLKLPSSIGGSLFLNSLTFAEGLKLPDSIGGSINLHGLASAERGRLRRLYPNLRI